MPNKICENCGKEVNTTIKLIAEASNGSRLQVTDEFCKECFKKMINYVNKVTVISDDTLNEIRD